jgi:hypothetical protein
MLNQSNSTLAHGHSETAVFDWKWRLLPQRMVCQKESFTIMVEDAEFEKLLFNNSSNFCFLKGHGGSGFSMCWGTGYEIAEKIRASWTPSVLEEKSR